VRRSAIEQANSPTTTVMTGNMRYALAGISIRNGNSGASTVASIAANTAAASDSMTACNANPAPMAAVDGPVGHGFANRPSQAVANHDGYYSFSPRAGLRFIVLDALAKPVSVADPDPAALVAAYSEVSV